MELNDAYKKFVERHQEVQEKLTQLAALVETVMTAERQFRRPEMERYELLCQQLEAAFEDFAHARARFGRALQGES